jgi:hypothetical protein
LNICDELGDMRWTMACHISIFGKMTAQRIDDLGTLAHQQVAGSERNRGRLLFLAAALLGG